ncbi:hypothetical protein SAMD00020551_2629 [Mesobacillus selenatarsenatis SF-1]|uniref:Uncharacterized protein n=1 Tax=Mesobacillus selenatarsenatis (strain DSM 18680 / JCM 14380 / FERM P-15431 / SF-1) TaxID=1321606 RepID=A0A0A8X3J0_MESS1|nr:hypothetical protein SAMD00020551_2629 [Mesobacillus selenatarsenatis SF-1]
MVLSKPDRGSGILTALPLDQEKLSQKRWYLDSFGLESRKAVIKTTESLQLWF